MNRDEIEDMAREAGFGTVDTRILEHFATLVAAEEREACARVCEGRANGYQYATDPYAHEHITEANYCAAAIRARSVPTHTSVRSV